MTGDRVYQVAPGDTLWSIAAAELGNPWRWPEIYHLNRERAEPDGQHLADPDLIYPGWTLLVPASSAAPPRPAASHPHPRHPRAPCRARASAPSPGARPAPGHFPPPSRPPWQQAGASGQPGAAD